ncbi:MAG: DUF3226 domain-containing protein [Desulfomonilaceae bacterium]
MRRHPPNVFEKPWVLLCEGESDLRFFNRLIEDRELDSRFYVQFPDRGEHRTGGRTNFGWWLQENRTVSETFRTKVEAILVVADKDDDEAESFGIVQQQILTSGFPVPLAECTVAKAPGFPSIVVLMIPMDEAGNLETLCLHAADSKWNLADPIARFIIETPANGWRPSKQSKMKLQTTLAATCETCPDTSFTHHWFQREEYLIPLDHSCFNSVADFLTNFGTLIS